MSCKSLSGLRRSAPSKYRTSSALAKPGVPLERPANTRYVTVGRYTPRSLEELHDACGQYAHAAILETLWYAVSRFLMDGIAHGVLSNPDNVACTSVNLCRNADRVRGYPCLTDIPRLNILPSLSLPCQAEARRVAEETIEDWKRAGSPYLLLAIARTHETVALYQRRHPSPLELRIDRTDNQRARPSECRSLPDPRQRA